MSDFIADLRHAVSDMVSWWIVALEISWSTEWCLQVYEFILCTKGRFPLVSPVEDLGWRQQAQCTLYHACCLQCWCHVNSISRKCKHSTWVNWVKHYIRDRQRYGAYSTLLPELASSDMSKWVQYVRMDRLSPCFLPMH